MLRLGLLLITHQLGNWFLDQLLVLQSILGHVLAFLFVDACVLLKVLDELLDSELVFSDDLCFLLFSIMVIEAGNVRAEGVLLVPGCHLVGQRLDLIRNVQLVVTWTRYVILLELRLENARQALNKGYLFLGRRLRRILRLQSHRPLLVAPCPSCLSLLAYTDTRVKR